MDLTLSSQILFNPTTSGHSTMHSTGSIAMTTFQVRKRRLRSLNKKKSQMNKQKQPNQKKKNLINTAQGCPRDGAQEEEMTVCNILRRHSELCAMTLITNTNLEKTTISSFAQGSFECLYAPECIIWQWFEPI